MEAELVIASSPTDAGISCWDLHSGAEHLRYRSCSSPPHGLACVGGRFLASSQIRESKSSSGSIMYWSWSKPQAEVKSFPAEPINPLVSNDEGTYIAGGGISGSIYLWQVASGRLLKKWHAHYRRVTCLAFSDDQSLLISGAEDGSVRVWNLVKVLDDLLTEEATKLYEHSFSEHNLKVTDIAIGYGGWNAVIISSSEDRTCKVWSLSRGKLLRNIVFPSIVDAVALDPGEHVFYAGGRDGKIYIAALNAPGNPNSEYGLHIIGSLFEHSKAVTCLSFSLNGVLLVSGSEDGMVRIWDTTSRNIVRVLRHAKGPVSNIIIIRQPSLNPNAQASSGRKHASLMPPALEKYAASSDDKADIKAFIGPHPGPDNVLDAPYITFEMMKDQIKELEQQGSSAAARMEVERLKSDCNRSMQMIDRWKTMYDHLHQFCIDEILDGDQVDNFNGKQR